MSLLRNIFSFIDGFSGQIALLLNIPWARPYLPVLFSLAALLSSGSS